MQRLQLRFVSALGRILRKLDMTGRSVRIETDWFASGLYFVPSASEEKAPGCFILLRRAHSAACLAVVPS
jgi:hypothetical protein